MIHRETVNITVRCEGPGAPLDIRLRRALKWLLRTHGLRAVRVSEARMTHAMVSNIDAGNVPQNASKGKL
jgi:hypothetical protein